MMMALKDFSLKGVFLKGITEESLVKFLKCEYVSKLKSLKLSISVCGNTMKYIANGLGDANFENLETLMIEMSD